MSCIGLSGNWKKLNPWITVQLVCQNFRTPRQQLFTPLDVSYERIKQQEKLDFDILPKQICLRSERRLLLLKYVLGRTTASRLQPIREFVICVSWICMSDN